MSDTLIDFAQPFLVDLPEDVGVDTQEKTLGIAAALWNVIVVTEVEAPDIHPSEPEWVNQRAVRESMALIRDIVDDSPPDEETITVLRTMALRKREVAPDDQRIVDKVTVRKKGGRVVVSAASTELSRIRR